MSVKSKTYSKRQTERYSPKYFSAFSCTATLREEEEFGTNHAWHWAFATRYVFSHRGWKGISLITDFHKQKKHTTSTVCCWFCKDAVKVISWKLSFFLFTVHIASNLGHAADHLPDIEDEEETRCWDSQLQFTPVSYEVRHSGQQNVAKAKEVVGDYTSQHPLLRSCPFCACLRHKQDRDTWITQHTVCTHNRYLRNYM